MGEVIKEALLIDVNGMKTMCIVVENLPKELIYYKTRRLMPIEEYSERLVPAFTFNEDGKKILTGEQIDELLPGIALDGAGSGAFMFDMGSDDSKIRANEITAHITEVIKDPALRGVKVYYAQQANEPASPPKALHTIPRVKLPLPASPPDVPTSEQVAALAPVKRVMSEESKAKLRINLAKARAAKKSIPQA